MTDLGPGDVVEALDSEPGYWSAGDRHVVVALKKAYKPCVTCGDSTPVGLTLSGLGDWCWCVQHWRKIGGSREDTAARFREDLTVRAPDLERV